MFAHQFAHRFDRLFDRLVATREVLNTALGGLLLLAILIGMTGMAKAEDVADELGAYDREMLTSLIEAVIAVDEGDTIITAAIPENAAKAAEPGAGPKSLAPGRRTELAAATVIPTAKPTVSKADPGFALQLGSYASAENAQRGFEAANAQYASALAEHTLYVQPVDLGSRGVFHRLRIGGFESLPMASAACSSLGIGIADCMIVSAAQQ